MPIFLREMLLATSLLTSIYMIRKIKKSQMQIEDTLFWTFLSMGLVILSVFPKIAITIASKIGIESPTNLIFLVIIFLLLIKNFMLSIRMSQLEYKIRTLVQRIAISEKGKGEQN